MTNERQYTKAVDFGDIPVGRLFIYHETVWVKVNRKDAAFLNAEGPGVAQFDLLQKSFSEDESNEDAPIQLLDGGMVAELIIEKHQALLREAAEQTAQETLDKEKNKIMEVYKGYGWVITREFIDSPEAVGKMGPRDVEFSQEYIEKYGAEFQMYDDDGNLYFIGKILGDYQGFEPLDDFGTAWAGATYIKYLNQETNTWEII